MELESASWLCHLRALGSPVVEDTGPVASTQMLPSQLWLGFCGQFGGVDLGPPLGKSPTPMLPDLSMGHHTWLPWASLVPLLAAKSLPLPWDFSLLPPGDENSAHSPSYSCLMPSLGRLRACGLGTQVLANHAPDIWSGPSWVIGAHSLPSG